MDNKELIRKLISFDDESTDISTGYVGVGKTGENYPTVLEILEMIKELLCDDNYDFKYRLSNVAPYDINRGKKNYRCPKGLEHAPCWVRCGVKRKVMTRWYMKTLVFSYGDTNDIRPGDTVQSYYNRNKYNFESMLYDMVDRSCAGWITEEYHLGEAARTIYYEYCFKVRK